MYTRISYYNALGLYPKFRIKQKKLVESCAAQKSRDLGYLQAHVTKKLSGHLTGELLHAFANYLLIFLFLGNFPCISDNRITNNCQKTVIVCLLN